MFSRKMLTFAISVIGVVFAVSICIGLSGSIAMAWHPEGHCWNDWKFTKEFYLEECDGFSNEGVNPFFILEPGYQLVLESDEERAVVTVLDGTYTVAYEGVVTRVVEERAFEWDDEEEDWVLVEISENYFAICNRTNDVYYFGEFSRDCEDGFDEDDDCEGEESNEGSWEAGVDDAKPGLIMPGTFLLGSKYFQEWAPNDEAVDRGQNVKMGLTVTTEAGTFENCVKIIDTNPAEGICRRKDGDPKIYCPGVGLVKDEDLELVEIIKPTP